jgi:hypothetical protein
VQTPPGQVSVALAKSHGTPQLPQLTTVVVLVSQPLLGLPSQLANPALHVGAHAPAAHTVLPLGLLQATPHPPQFESVFSGVSQPFAALPSQLPNPALQDTSAQVPFWQAPTPFAYVQALLQAPQLVRLVLVLVSQPLLGLASQLAKPAAQTGVQTLAVQEVVPLAFVQTVVQVPQWLTSFAELISQPSA